MSTKYNLTSVAEYEEVNRLEVRVLSEWPAESLHQSGVGARVRA